MSSDADRRRVETGDLATQAALRVPAPPLPKASVPGPVRVSAKPWRPTPGDGDLATDTWRPTPDDGDLATVGLATDTWRPTPGYGDLATATWRRLTGDGDLETERKQTYEKPCLVQLPSPLMNHFKNRFQLSSLPAGSSF